MTSALHCSAVIVPSFITVSSQRYDNTAFKCTAVSRCRPPEEGYRVDVVGGGGSVLCVVTSSFSCSFGLLPRSESTNSYRILGFSR